MSLFYTLVSFLYIGLFWEMTGLPVDTSLYIGHFSIFWSLCYVYVSFLRIGLSSIYSPLLGNDSSTHPAHTTQPHRHKKTQT